MTAIQHSQSETSLELPLIHTGKTEVPPMYGPSSQSGLETRMNLRSIFYLVFLCFCVFWLTFFWLLISGIERGWSVSVSLLATILIRISSGCHHKYLFVISLHFHIYLPTQCLLWNITLSGTLTKHTCSVKSELIQVQFWLEESKTLSSISYICDTVFSMAYYCQMTKQVEY